MKLVSIIIPFYKKKIFFPKTLLSIINQKHKKLEIIIVYDDIEIEDLNFLKKISKIDRRINLIINKKNIGAGLSRNKAMKLAKGNFLAFIDSDDIWKKSKLKKQIFFMSKNNYDFTYTRYETFSDVNNKINYINPPKKLSYLGFIKNTSIGTSTMIIKRKIAKKIKFLNTKICEDYYFKCKVLKKVKTAYCLNDYLTKYRIRKKSLQSNKINNVLAIWKINKLFNKLNILDNFISIFSISYNSIKKYGLK